MSGGGAVPPARCEDGPAMMNPRTQRRVVIAIASLIGLAMVLTIVITPTL